MISYFWKVNYWKVVTSISFVRVVFVIITYL